MNAQTAVEVEEEDTPHVVTLVDDDGILVAQCTEVGKGRSEHGVCADVAQSRLLVILPEARLHAGDVRNDAVLGQVRNDLVEDRKRIFERHGIDDKFWPESLNLLHRSETLRVVEKAHALGIYLIYGTFVFETQYVGKEATHLTGSQYKYSHRL